MKKLFFFIFIFIYNFQIEAQENLKKFSIGLATFLEKNLSSEIVAFNEYMGYAAAYDKTNYKIGIILEYNIADKISLNSAINYANKDFTGTFYCAVCDFIVQPTPQDIEFRFIEVPLTLKYYFLPRKINLFGEAGLNNLIVLSNNFSDASYGLGIKLGSGVAYKFSNDVKLIISIDYNRGLTNLYQDSNFKIETLAYGIGIMKKL